MAFDQYSLLQMHLGTKTGSTNPDQSDNSGLITDDTLGVHQTQDLNLASFGIGSYGFFDPTTYNAVIAAPATCCPLIIASTTPLTVDKIGMFHGGYLETIKSKPIDPRRILKLWRTDPCDPIQNIVHVGATSYTAAGGVLTTAIATPGTYTTAGTYTDVRPTGGTGSGLVLTVVVNGSFDISAVTVTNPGRGYTAADVVTVPTTEIPGSLAGTITVSTVRSATTDCCKEFLCASSYNLLLEIQGTPILHFLDRNGYSAVGTWTGCCPDDDPLALVDSTLVFIAWADMILGNVTVNPFVQIIIYGEDGFPLYAPGTNGGVDEWDDYVSPGHTANQCAGMKLTGAYVGTTFQDCTFMPNDFYDKYPISLIPQEVDNNGDPCTFTGLCIVTQCDPVMGNGFGETVLRELISSMQYSGVELGKHEDLRIREVTHGTDIIAAVDRTAQFYRYNILFTVPMYSNPTSVNENTQYTVTIVTSEIDPDLETFLAAWLDTCSNCPTLQTFGCVAACPA